MTTETQQKPSPHQQRTLPPPQPSRADQWLCAFMNLIYALGVGSYMLGRCGVPVAVVVTVGMIVTLTVAIVAPDAVLKVITRTEK